MGEPLPFFHPMAPFLTVHLHTAFLPFIPASQSSLLLVKRVQAEEDQGPVVALVMEAGTRCIAGLLTTPTLPCRRETLQDVSFTVMPGQTLALVRGDPATLPNLLDFPLFRCPW